MSSVRDTAIAPAPAKPAPTGEVGRDVGVVQALAVGPRELTVRVREPGRTRARDRRWRRGRSRSSWAACRSVPSGSGTHPVSVAGGCPGARSGCPRQLGATRAEKPVYVGCVQVRPESVENWTPGHADARRERTRPVVPGVARLHVDVVVGARSQDVGFTGFTARPGSFCLFCENNASLLPTVTSVDPPGVSGMAPASTGNKMVIDAAAAAPTKRRGTHGTPHTSLDRDARHGTSQSTTGLADDSRGAASHVSKDVHPDPLGHYPSRAPACGRWCPNNPAENASLDRSRSPDWSPSESVARPLGVVELLGRQAERPPWHGLGMVAEEPMQRLWVS